MHSVPCRTGPGLGDTLPRHRRGGLGLPLVTAHHRARGGMRPPVAPPRSPVATDVCGGHPTGGVVRRRPAAAVAARWPASSTTLRARRATPQDHLSRNWTTKSTCRRRFRRPPSAPGRRRARGSVPGGRRRPPCTVCCRRRGQRLWAHCGMQVARTGAALDNSGAVQPAGAAALAYANGRHRAGWSRAGAWLERGGRPHGPRPALPIDNDTDSTYRRGASGRPSGRNRIAITQFALGFRCSAVAAARD